MAYVPLPVDTSNVSVEKGISAIAELLARNFHEVWAQARLVEGWRWGPKRDDVQKEDPNLVPYEQLNETEKKYDRHSALESLKLIQILGYRITPSNKEPAVNSAEQPLSEQHGTLVHFANKRRLLHLIQLWHRRDYRRWIKNPHRYQVLAERLLEMGEPLLAYDVIQEGMRLGSATLRLRQLQALALGRCGATEHAAELLLELIGEGHNDEETLGMMGRTYKDLAERAKSLADRDRNLQLAFEAYVLAYETSGGYWSGINAATLAVCLNRPREATAIARKVRSQCLAIQQKNRVEINGYWMLATLGEACLILANIAEAELYYERAASAGRTMIGNLAATRRNALLLSAHLGVNVARILEILNVPRIGIFASVRKPSGSGHETSLPHGSESRFAGVLANRLKALNIQCGYSCAANSWDLVFLETVAQLNGEAHVVLPTADDGRWLETDCSVPGGDARRREKALLQAAEVMTASPHTVTLDSVSFEYTDLLLQGMATVRAKYLGTEVVLIVTGQPDHAGKCGATSMVLNAERLGHRIERIEIGNLMVDQQSIPLRGPTEQCATSGTPIMAVLFADVVGYSGLAEHEIPQFVQHFLGLVASVVDDSQVKPVLKNTWGDGLYFVFDSVRAAGEFALDLRNRVSAKDWIALKFRNRLTLRIGLHAGPVYGFMNPITRQHDYTGTHVSWAARIEPITPAGEVYCSNAFAALAAMRADLPFVCEYAGRIPLGKGFGVFPLYHVRQQAFMHSQQMQGR